MADYYLRKTAAHIDELLEKVEGLDNYDDTEVRGLINNKVDKEIGKGLSANDFTDAYKETLDGLDTALDGKVDKETGKGLSTNDYTTSEKTKLNGIESGANVNVQADWNQTDTTADDYIKNKPTIPAAQVNADWNAVSGVAQILNKPAIYTTAQTDTLLDGKLDAGAVSSTGTEATGWNNCRLSGGKIQYYNTNTTYSLATTSSSGLMSASDKQKLNGIAAGATNVTVDTDLSSTSTNPVQNKAIQAPLAVLIDNGAKNLLNLGTGEINPSVTTRGVTWTKDTLTGAVIANGTSESGGSYPAISVITLKPGTYFMRGGTQRIAINESSRGTRDSGNGASFTVTNNTVQPIRISVIANANTTFNDEAIYPMICSSEDYAVSPTFQPYAPTNRELYEMILTLQNAQNGG